MKGRKCIDTFKRKPTKTCNSDFLEKLLPLSDPKKWMGMIEETKDFGIQRNWLEHTIKQHENQETSFKLEKKSQK